MRSYTIQKCNKAHVILWFYDKMIDITQAPLYIYTKCLIIKTLYRQSCGSSCKKNVYIYRVYRVHISSLDNRTQLTSYIVYARIYGIQYIEAGIKGQDILLL